MLVFIKTGLFIFTVFTIGLAQPGNKSISVETILDSLAARFDRIEDYSVKIKVSVKMPKFRMPKKKIKLYFKQPDKIKIKSSGFAVVPKTGLAMAPKDIFRSLFDITVTPQKKDGNNFLLVAGKVNPDSIKFRTWESSANAPLSMNVWVNADDWLVTKMDTYLDTSRVMSLLSSYKEVEKGIRLPVLTEMHFQLGEGILENIGKSDPMGGPFGEHNNEFNFDEENGFHGTVRLEFSKYKVNRGLSDKLFEEEPE